MVLGTTLLEEPPAERGMVLLCWKSLPLNAASARPRRQVILDS